MRNFDFSCQDNNLDHGNGEYEPSSREKVTNFLTIYISAECTIELIFKHLDLCC